MPSLEGKHVLVTGGGGFIGSTLVEQIFDADPDTISVFDHDEQNLFALRQEVPPAGRRSDVDLDFNLGDIRDRDRVDIVMEDVDVVFHAGAIKHVGMSEYNPWEAVKTNLQGTRNVINAAIEKDVESVTAISTDKASNPVSVMGATKLIMERLLIGMNQYTGPSGTKFNCVRFGNVAGATGSVVPVFIEQIREGGPITVTDPDMTRFIMSADHAVELVLDAYERMQAGEVVVLKMPAFRVGDLAEGLRREYAPRFGYSPSEIEIEEIGKRPAERMHEKLISWEEIEKTVELSDTFVILPEIDLGEESSVREPDNSLTSEYTSSDAELISPAEIADLVRQTKAHPEDVEERSKTMPVSQ